MQGKNHPSSSFQVLFQCLPSFIGLEVGKMLLVSYGAFLTTHSKYLQLFLKLGFGPCKAEQPLQGIELQEKEAHKDNSIQEISLQRTHS